MTAIRQLAPQLHEIAWSAVEGPAADPWAEAGGTRDKRRAGSLQLLAVYSQLIKVLQRRIDLTIKDALDAGSDYGKIATACGVSRQAIRQRWLRRTKDSRWFEVWQPSPRSSYQASIQPHAHEAAQVVLVRLAGGPYDGARAMPSPGEILKYEADSPPTKSSGPIPLLAWYVPSQDDANVYVFAGVERDAWRMHTGQLLPPGGALANKPHVYQLAAEFGVESKIIMAMLEEMGEFIRSASSTVEHLAAYKLRIQFAAQSQPSLMRQASGTTRLSRGLVGQDISGHMKGRLASCPRVAWFPALQWLSFTCYSRLHMPIREAALARL